MDAAANRPHDRVRMVVFMVGLLLDPRAMMIFMV
jgi:hypothetical protein